MTHEYSKFKNKNIPYAKVGRRVFNSLFDAETFCTEHGFDVNSAIEYRDDPELKNNIQTIAQYQKAILQECLDRLNPLAKKYADIPFRTFYVHPKNSCLLEALALRGEQLEKWNTRNA